MIIGVEEKEFHTLECRKLLAKAICERRTGLRITLRPAKQANCRQLSAFNDLSSELCNTLTDLLHSFLKPSYLQVFLVLPARFFWVF